MVPFTGRDNWGKNTKFAKKWRRMNEYQSARAEQEARWKEENGIIDPPPQKSIDEFASPPPLTLEQQEEKAKAKEMAELTEALQEWPWAHKAPKYLPTLAPYMINHYPAPEEPFIWPEEVQTSRLFEILNVAPINDKIMRLLFARHKNSANFALTCRRAFKVATAFLKIWDMSVGNFNNCDRLQVKTGDKDQGSVAPVVIVTPVRGPSFLSQLKKVDENKVNLTQLDTGDVVPFYTNQLNNVQTMCLGMSNFADNFSILQLHRVPMLTVRVLELVIPKMRNLRTLGVYRCQLIHVGDGMKLLEIIKTDKVLEKENQVDLDFYPNFHHGPVSEPGMDYAHGSFGPVWDNWNRDTTLAIWCIVAPLVAQAKLQDIDLLSRDAMFLKWLHDTPCMGVSQVVKLIKKGEPSGDDAVAQYVATIHWRGYSGSVSRLQGHIGNRPEGWEWMCKTYNCRACESSKLGVFFEYCQIRDAINDGTVDQLPSMLKCLGCEMTHLMETERDHYKDWKRKTIQCWLRDDDASSPTGWNTTDLPKALSDYHTRDIPSIMYNLDWRRYEEMHLQENPKYCYDGEFQARQRPLTKAELGRLGMKNFSPRFHEKVFKEKHHEEQMKNPDGLSKYDTWDHTRWRAHGFW